MTNIQCCEDGWVHVLKIANSQTHNTVLFMPRPSHPCMSLNYSLIYLKIGMNVHK